MVVVINARALVKLSSRFIHVPACIIVGLMGLIVEIPLYTAIAIVKSPYMLFKGWHRLLHDLISREGPFLETACIPVAGLAIIMWPLVVVGSILLAIFTSFFIGLYASVVVYQVCASPCHRSWCILPVSLCIYRCRKGRSGEVLPM